MLFLLSSLITILAISLIFKDKTLPAYIGVFASFVILNGSDILLGIIGVAIAAYILNQLIPSEYFYSS
tara:strand:+ start:1559 stop:1762 length:204 start_codon:yes stop_codon:yes gene_type:complete